MPRQRTDEATRDDKASEMDSDDASSNTSMSADEGERESSQNRVANEEEQQEEAEGLNCSLVLADTRRCSGQLTASPKGLHFSSRADPGHVFDISYDRIRWAGWRAAEQGSRGENGGYLHLELHRTVLNMPSTPGSKRQQKRKTGRSAARDETEHTFVHFAAGGPRAQRNSRLRAIVADVARFSSHAPGRTQLTEENDHEEEATGALRIERIGRGSDIVPGVVGNTGVCRVHFTPTAIVQLDHRPFIVLPYQEIEVACLERALFKPALRNFDLTLVRKSIWESVTSARKIGGRSKRLAAQRRSGPKRKRGDPSDDEPDEENVIGGKNLSVYLAQIFSIPTEHLERIEKHLRSENVPHYRGLANVQWPPLLNYGTNTPSDNLAATQCFNQTVRENPDEFKQTGGWAEYLKPQSVTSTKTSRTETDDGEDEGSEGEDEMWGNENGDSDGGEFMPDVSLLNASYSEIEEAEDGDKHSGRKATRRSKAERKASEKRSASTSKARRRERKNEDGEEGTKKRRRMRSSARSDLYKLLDMTEEPSIVNEHKKTTRRKSITEKRKKPSPRKQNTRKRPKSDKPQAIEIVDSDADKKPAKRRKKDTATEAVVKRRKRDTSGDDRKESKHPDRPDDETTKGNETLVSRKRRKGSVGNESGGSKAVALTRSQQVHQRQFTGYGTRSKGSISTEPQDKIIRIDPPTTRRRKRNQTRLASATESAKQEENAAAPKDLKAEERAEHQDSRVSRAGYEEGADCSGDESLDSFRGDDGASTPMSLETEHVPASRPFALLSRDIQVQSPILAVD